MVLASWNDDELAARQRLKTVAQHRIVDLREDVFSDLLIRSGLMPTMSRSSAA